MPKAILLEAPGGPEKLLWKDVPMPEPGQGEILIRQSVAGLNFIDVYHRTGFYPLPYPAILGMEGVGIVEKLGPGCVNFQIGQRVAYGVGPVGAYAQYRVLPEVKAIRLPDTVTSEIAAACLLKGLTAHFLLRRTFIAGPNHTILIHAAAGGVGLILCQWAKHLGARVIGTVGSEEKAALAKSHGCDFPILYRKEDVVARVKEITNGRGVNAVYDSVGKDTWKISLDCLMKLGIFILYGQASGPVPPIDPLELSRRGSLFFTRPSLMHYKEDQREYVEGAAELLDLVIRGIIRVNVGQSYYLSDAASAHRDLEAGKTHGSTILVVN